MFPCFFFRGGLHPGDIVVQINGKAIHNTSEIYSFLSDKAKTLKMTIYRGTRKLELNVTPEDMEE